MRIHPGCLALVFGLWLAACSPARAQDIDPAFRADIVKMMELTGTSKIGHQMATMISQQMLRMMKAQHPEVPAHGFGVVKEVAEKEFEDAFEGRPGCSREWSLSTRSTSPPRTCAG
jgi:hypothetical protein